MPKYEKISTLMALLTELLANQTNPETIRTMALEKVRASNVNAASKLSMIQTLESAKDPLATVYNLILKYEGNGVIK